MHPHELPPPPPRSSGLRGKWQPIGLAAAIGAGCIYVALVDPNTSTTFPQCPFKAMTGWDCPGCGVTRAVYALLHVDIVGALSHNVAFVLALPFILWALVVWGARSVGRNLPMFTWRPWMTVAGSILVVAFAVVRNIPQFEWLAAT